MTFARLILVLMLAPAAIAPTRADQSADLKPKVLRQIYDDKSYSEIECGGPDAESRITCDFRRNVSGSTGAWAFNLNESGYFIAPSMYRYLPTNDSFLVGFSVACKDIDLSVNLGAAEDNTGCMLWLSPVKDRLYGKSVSVNSIIDGERVANSRSLHSPVEP